MIIEHYVIVGFASDANDPGATVRAEVPAHLHRRSALGALDVSTDRRRLLGLRPVYRISTFSAEALTGRYRSTTLCALDTYGGCYLLRVMRRSCPGARRFSTFRAEVFARFQNRVTDSAGRHAKPPGVLNVICSTRVVLRPSFIYGHLQGEEPAAAVPQSFGASELSAMLRIHRRHLRSERADTQVGSSRRRAFADGSQVPGTAQ